MGTDPDAPRLPPAAGRPGPARRDNAGWERSVPRNAGNLRA